MEILAFILIILSLLLFILLIIFCDVVEDWLVWCGVILFFLLLFSGCILADIAHKYDPEEYPKDKYTLSYKYVTNTSTNTTDTIYVITRIKPDDEKK